MAKENSWNVAKGKADKNKPVEKEDEKEKSEKRKMIRIGEDYHTSAKFKLAPSKMLGIQEYIEALIQMDIDGHIDWGKYNKG